MNNIIIYGAGGFGRETALLIKQINWVKPQWNILGFLDDNLKKSSSVDGYQVLGGEDYLKELNGTSVAIAIADPRTRKAIGEKLIALGASCPSLIHPSVNKGDEQQNTFGDGCIIGAGTIFTTNIALGKFVIVNLSCTIGHDVKIDSYSSIMPQCSLSGFIEMGEGVYVGSGARILPGIKVGIGATVGAGAVVTKHIAPGKTVAGVPATDLESLRNE